MKKFNLLVSCFAAGFSGFVLLFGFIEQATYLMLFAILCDQWSKNK
jgi:hypothetical protein